MKISKVTRRPKFPEFEKPTTFTHVLQFIVGMILWILLLLIFVFTLYITWFADNLVYLLTLIKKKHYHIPFWFSALCTIFLFPATLVVIILGSFIKIIKE